MQDIPLKVKYIIIRSDGDLELKMLFRLIEIL